LSLEDAEASKEPAGHILHDYHPQFYLKRPQFLLRLLLKSPLSPKKVRRHDTMPASTPTRRRGGRALASPLSLFLLLLLASASLSSAQYQSSLPYGVPRDDITVRMSLLGSGLGPVGRGELGVTVKAFQDSLNWLGDSIAVRGAKLERRPVDGTATVDVTVSADARRLDLIKGLIAEKVSNQEVRKFFCC